MASVSSGGAMLSREEENDNPVRRVDQDNINKFGRLNARLEELREEKEILEQKLEGIEDASTELMTGTGERVMLKLGESFFDATEEEATDFCEEQVEKHQAAIDRLAEEEASITEEQAELKKLLYGRFGKSIQLEA